MPETVEDCQGSDFALNMGDCLEIHMETLRDNVVSNIRDAVMNTVNNETENALANLAESINSAVAYILDVLLGWIVGGESLDLSTGSEGTTIGLMGIYLDPIVMAVAVVGILVAAGQMVLTRKANPLLPVGRGIFVIIAVQAIGIPVANALISFGDIWSEWVITDARDRGVEERLIFVLTFGQYSGGDVDPETSVGALWASTLLITLFGVIVAIVAAIQIVLMIFREAVIVILAAMLPLAAAGMLMQSTSSWLTKVTSWMLALIMYKPAVAAVYAITFIFIAEGNDLNTYLTGVMMLIVSLFSMKVLTSLFSWATGSVASPGGLGGGGGGGSLAGGAIGAAIGAGSAAAGGSGASNQAADTNQRLGSADQGASGGGSGGSGGTQSPTGAKQDAAGQAASSSGSGSSGEAGTPDGAKPSTGSSTSSIADAGIKGSAAGPMGSALAAGAKAGEQATVGAYRGLESAASESTTPPDEQKGT
ncbi:hypothetical protein ABZ234_07970 [Nocardiopsis sp. NPDC006198]|uniref:hypothetical protein n=1 Tax=Nocardiopsis sp. NPDC006198 TaxID=3154472 RepID=UPI0033A989C8